MRSGFVGWGGRRVDRLEEVEEERRGRTRLDEGIGLEEERRGPKRESRVIESKGRTAEGIDDEEEEGELRIEKGRASRQRTRRRSSGWETRRLGRRRDGVESCWSSRERVGTDEEVGGKE